MKQKHIRRQKIKLASGYRVEVMEYVPGWYRMPIDQERTGLVRQSEGKWKADIRNQDGSIARHAGIWDTRREALAELVDIRNGEIGPVGLRFANRSAHCYEPH